MYTPECRILYNTNYLQTRKNAAVPTKTKKKKKKKTEQKIYSVNISIYFLLILQYVTQSD